MRAAGKTLIILGCAIFFVSSLIPYSDAEAGADVRAFLTKLENAVNKMNTYRFTVISENWKGRRHEKKTLRFQFKKPNLMRTDVLEGRKKGSSVVLNKDGKVRGKNSWGLKMTLRPTDGRLKNIRGLTFKNSSLFNKIEILKEHILRKGCIATVTEEECAGRRAYRLHVDHNDSDDPITHEDFWFDKETLMALKNLKYENETKVSDIKWLDFEINIPLDDDLFNM